MTDLVPTGLPFINLDVLQWTIWSLYALLSKVEQHLYAVGSDELIRVRANGVAHDLKV